MKSSKAGSIKALTFDKDWFFLSSSNTRELAAWLILIFDKTWAIILNEGKIRTNPIPKKDTIGR